MALGDGRGAGVGAVGAGEPDAARAVPDLALALAPVAHGVQGLAGLEVGGGVERDLHGGLGFLDRDLDAGALAARGRGDRGLAGLHARHLAGLVDRGHGRVAGLPRHGPVGRVARADRGGQLQRRVPPDRGLAVLHARTGDGHRRDRNIGRAVKRGQGGGGAVPLHDAAVICDARLAGTRVLVGAAVVEDHLRALGQIVRHRVPVRVRLLAAVRCRRGGHLHAGPGRVVRRGRTVAGVHVRVQVAPARRLGRVDRVLPDRIQRRDAGHRDGDRGGLASGLRGDLGSTRLHRSDRAVRCDLRNGFVGGGPGNIHASRIGGGGELDGLCAIGEVGSEVLLVDLHGVHGNNGAATSRPCAGSSGIAVPSVGAVDLQTGCIHAFGGIGRILQRVGGIAIVEDDADVLVESVRDFVLVFAILAAAVSCGDLRHCHAGPLCVLLERCRARIVHVHVGVQVRPVARLLGVGDADGCRILLGEGVFGGDGLAVLIGALQFQGDGAVDRGLSADGDGIAILVGTGSAFGRGVGGARHVGGVQRHLSGVGLEGTAGRVSGDAGKIAVVEHADLATLGGAGGDLATGDGQRSAIHLVGVGAVIQRGLGASQRLIAIHVHYGHAIGIGVAVLDVTFDHQAGIVTAVAHVFLGFGIVHLVAEVIHRYNLRILPRVGAGIAELALLRELRLVAAGADRSIEVQRHGLGSGADYAPPHSHFPFAHLHGRAIIVGLVGIVIVRFHPGNEIVATCGVVPIVEVASIQILRA